MTEEKISIHVRGLGVEDREKNYDLMQKNIIKNTFQKKLSSLYNF
ncbi:hypothetical protein [Bartonella sp. HY406]|nr:hypothetical protein [Bartonella sp. HY406]UXN02504.1 hypothetical protein N6B01_08405 [Bartonella sp. HY406]